jgi:hypothetical protein|nr:MAG TPA: IrrE protein [Caudoviricetes sp.]
MNKNKVYNITSNFISENKLFQYPIDLFSLCKIYGWKIKYYNKKDNKEFLQISTDGFVVQNNNKYIIFLNKDMLLSRQRFTIAHEIGHIILGHHNLDGYNLIANNGLDTDVEQEANMFARLILCPPQITRYLPKNANCISNLFKVSKQMAELTLQYSYCDLKGMEFIEDISYEKSIVKFQKNLGIETNIFEY